MLRVSAWCSALAEDSHLHENPNIQYRNTKQIPITETQMTKTQAPLLFVSVIAAFCHSILFRVSSLVLRVSAWCSASTEDSHLHENPNIQYRNTKQIPITETQMTKTQAPLLFVSVIAAFCHSILFRISSLVLRVSSAAQRHG